MHANELVELAALVATHSGVIVHGVDQIAARGVQRYWASSKCRLDRWAAVLRSRGQDRCDQPSHETTRGVLEEILTGETLTRVWAALSVAHDRTHGANEVEPIARSVYVAHLEARNRALNLIVRGPTIPLQHAVLLNQLRRKCERWTNLLLAFVMEHHDVSEFAFDRKQVRDFAIELRRDRLPGRPQTASQLVLASIRASLRKPSAPSPNADLNERITGSILACFHANLFDSIGLPQSLWMLRLNTTTNDALGMIDEFLTEPTGEPESLPRAPLQFKRRF